MTKNNLTAGIIGGLAGGVVFGILMGVMGMLPIVAKLVGASSPVIGFIVHLGISSVIGAIYSVLVADRIDHFGKSLVAGTGYGMFWWFFGPLTLMPFFLGMGFGVNWTMVAAGKMLPSLVGHIIYGIVLAGTYFRIKHGCTTCVK